MTFITAITFCIGASVADAGLNDCGWIVMPSAPWTTYEQCNTYNQRLLSSNFFLSNVYGIVRSHPEFHGEWDIIQECISEQDWPEFQRMIIASQSLEV